MDFHQDNAQIQRLKQMEAAAQSTFWGYLGCQLESLSDREVVLKLDIQPHHLNLLGILHGGVYASLLDNAMGLAAMAARPDDKIVTTNLNIHFVSPVQKGILTTRAKIVHMSRKSVTAQGKVLNDSGDLCALATGSFRVI